MTLVDVAKAAGVSVATVDRVLNGRAQVSNKRAQLVYEAARALQYHGLPILRARAPQPSRRFRLGVALRRRHNAFYQAIEAEIRLAAARCYGYDVELSFHYQSDNSPEEALALVKEMGRSCQAIALMAPESSALSEAILELRQRNVFTFSLLSDFAVDFRQAYIGLNNRQAGRSAAWGIAHTARRPGDVALIVGTYSYTAHEMRELGFRSYMRERQPNFSIVETATTAESVDAVRHAAGQILDRCPNLVGIYVVSGGFEGALEALVSRGKARQIALVANEITPASRQGLQDGSLAMVIGTPVRQLARQLIEEAVSAIETNGAELSRPDPLPIDLIIAENLR